MKEIVIALRWPAGNLSLLAMRPSRKTAYVVTAALTLAIAWFAGGREEIASLRMRGTIARLAESSPGRLPSARFTALRDVRRTSAAVVSRGAGDDLELKALVADVVAHSTSLPIPEGRSAAAAALVIARDWTAAIHTLDRAVAEEPNDASLWSDLAAARYERAAAVDDIEGLLAALVAADRSRQLEPNHARALFNRALILERVGLRVSAIDAWHACIASNDPLLAAEARGRLVRLEVPGWSSAESELMRAAAAGDAAVVQATVDRFPQDARAYADVIYLTNWAKAFLSGDSETAAKNLELTRAIGTALRKRGETLLAEAVDEIDEASAESRRILAVAQQDYDRGRDAYRDAHFAEAERILNASARGFAVARSPMASVARAYALFAILAAQRTDEGRDALMALAREVRALPTHRALLAYIQWELGRCEAVRGRWNESVDALQEARMLFGDLGETKNAGAMDGLLAEVYELVGRTDLAWPHCAAAFRGVSEEGNPYRLEVAVAGAQRIAMGMGQWDVAASLLDVEMTIAATVRQPVLIAEAHRRRFIVENERNNPAARDAALVRARVAAAHAGDEVRRQNAELDRAEATVALRTDPQRAVVLLSRALELEAAADQRLFVADLLRQRGEAQLALGKLDAARDDFAAGVAEIERQRGDIASPELRAQFLDTSERLFDDAMEVEVRRGDADAAFLFADRTRARALLDATGLDARATAAMIQERIDRNAALIELAMTPDELIVFCIRAGRVSMRRVDITARALQVKIDALRSGGDHESSDLESVLFDGIRNEIATAAKLIIIPDDNLQRVPFAALRNKSTGQYLVESHAITIAPSAALIASRMPAARTSRAALLIGSPAGSEEESLPYLQNVDDELAALRRIYRTPRVLFGPDATKSRFLAEAPNYDVIHFSGHGLSDEESLTASLLFAKTSNDSGRMYMSDIAKLKLPRAPLVVLAACGTLRGKAAGVEGMPSLARSFLAAGASTVVGTLWDIDDAKAAPLLESFHRHIVEGDSPAKALRSAQLEAIARGGDDAKPVNWAPFVVYTATP